jgi:alkanesulfonate monooxygenase SsuD/methylene tetrahydromethanopterin reductase-like flavin-dependent oxidoreductase (luciferase family)
LIPVPPVEKAIAFLDADGSRAAGGLPMRTRRRVVGSPATVKKGLEEVVREYQADEAMIVTITFDHEARRRSYELIADAFALRSQR